MSWREKIGLGELNAIRNEEVTQYLKNVGFEEGLMHPTYGNDHSHIDRILEYDRISLVLNQKVPGTDKWVSIYINDVEAYMEESSYSFDRSSYVKIEEELTMETIDEILDDLL